MSELQGITRLGFRVVLDSLEDSIGTNGKNALLNYTKLEQYITDPPDYDPTERISTEQYQQLWSGVRIILGNKGYNSVGYRAGMRAVRDAHERNTAYQALVAGDQDPVEKLLALVSAYLYMGDMNPEELMEHLPEEKAVLMHRPDCNECVGISTNKEITKDITRPGCAVIVGALTELTNMRGDLLKAAVEETQCKLMGDPECTFRITYEVV
jgi:hypothetical protein